MTNKNKKITAFVLLMVALGLLIYNITTPYQESTSKEDTVSTISSTNEYERDVSIQTSKLSEDINLERQPTQEEVWREKYTGNQLANGAQPYSALYGRNKQSGTSEIIVTAPTNEDALVMVKNSGGKVLRHAYIRTGRSYTFHISAGYYQVYFICGEDWCPEKEAPNGQMGFFLSSSTSKDDVQYIDNYQSLTYTLQSMVNGNFIPQNTSSNEAF